MLIGELHSCAERSRSMTIKKQININGWKHVWKN